MHANQIQVLAYLDTHGGQDSRVMNARSHDK